MSNFQFNININSFSCRIFIDCKFLLGNRRGHILCMIFLFCFFYLIFYYWVLVCLVLILHILMMVNPKFYALNVWRFDWILHAFHATLWLHLHWHRIHRWVLKIDKEIKLWNFQLLVITENVQSMYCI